MVCPISVGTTPEEEEEAEEDETFAVPFAGTLLLDDSTAEEELAAAVLVTISVLTDPETGAGLPPSMPTARKKDWMQTDPISLK